MGEPIDSANRKKSAAQTLDLSRALEVLGEIEERQEGMPEKLESLRRAADILDQLVRQLRGLEQNRPMKK